MIVPDHDGAEVVGLDGARIGRVERTYLSDHLQIRFVEVKIGTVVTKHRLIPTDQATLEDNVLAVPYTKGTVVDSPDVSGLGDTLEGDALTAVHDYYDPPPKLETHVEDSENADDEPTDNEESAPAGDTTAPLPLMASAGSATHTQG